MFSVLRTVHHLGLNASGTEVRASLARQTGDQDLEAALIYGALKRLEAQGLVTSSDATERPAGRKGRPRRIYVVTASGLRAIEAGSKLYAQPEAQMGAFNDDQEGQPAGVVRGLS